MVIMPTTDGSSSPRFFRGRGFFLAGAFFSSGAAAAAKPPNSISLSRPRSRALW